MTCDPALLAHWREATGLGDRLLWVAVRTFDYNRRFSVAVEVSGADGKVVRLTGKSVEGGGERSALAELKKQLVADGLLQ